MKMTTTNLQTKQHICERASDAAAYLDGEMSLESEFDFELHLENCRACRAEINVQKRLLHELEMVFSDERNDGSIDNFELPADFTKKIVVRAEADVTNLSKTGSERRKAVLTTLGLFLFGVTVGFVGKKSGFLPPIVENAAHHVVVVANVFGNFLYDFGAGSLIATRAVGRQLSGGFSLPGIFLLILLLVSCFALSRLIFKYHRV